MPQDEMSDDLAAIDLGSDRTATALVAGNAHTCALLDDATVKCWGKNDLGQLGQDDTENLGDDADEMGDDLAAIDLAIDPGADRVIGGGDDVPYTATALVAGR